MFTEVEKVLGATSNAVDMGGGASKPPKVSVEEIVAEESEETPHTSPVKEKSTHLSISELMAQAEDFEEEAYSTASSSRLSLTDTATIDGQATTGHTHSHTHASAPEKAFRKHHLDIAYFDVNSTVQPYPWLGAHKEIMVAYGVRLPARQLVGCHGILEEKNPIPVQSGRGKKLRSVLNVHGWRLIKGKIGKKVQVMSCELNCSFTLAYMRACILAYSLEVNPMTDPNI
jgi:hypothetical protein